MFILTPSNTPQYLLHEGLLTLAPLVDGGVRVLRSESRNTVFRVGIRGQSGYLIKQPRVFDAEHFALLKREATCYWLAWNDPAFAGLQAFLPRFHRYDDQSHVLILELIEPARSLYSLQMGKPALALALAEKQAEILATLHTSLSLERLSGPALQLFDREVPWVFSITTAARTEGADEQLIGLVKRDPVMTRLLQETREAWTPSCLIHGDIRWPNFLLTGAPRASEPERVLLIDWEGADVGDPCWDLASTFTDHLIYWFEAEGLDSGRPPGEIGPALGVIREAVPHFWRTYVARAGLGLEQERRMLHKVLRFCGPRLLLSCLENTQVGDRLDAATARLLQLGFNIGTQPEKAGAFFFHLSP